MKNSIWCPADPRLPIKPPLVIDVRTPFNTEAALAQFDGEQRYVKRDLDGNGTLETCCNFYVVDTCQVQGVIIPRVDNRYPRATELVEGWLARSGWLEVAEWVAVKLVELGVLGIVGNKNYNTTSGHPGHVARLVAARRGERGTFISQAGSTNFNHGTLAQGFGHNAKGLKFFVWQDKEK